MSRASNIQFLREVFQSSSAAEAIAGQDHSVSYDWLLHRIEHWCAELSRQNVPCGAVVSLEADFSPDGVALFLAMAEHGCILVPLTQTAAPQIPELLDISEAEYRFIAQESGFRLTTTGHQASHTHYTTLRKRHTPGLVLFSSGSTGKSKATVHDLSALLEKFKTPRRPQRTLTFLLYDHLGGVDTMLYTLSSAGCLITVPDRSPDTVLAAIERHKAELLPTSPTFLNLILISRSWARYDLSSLRRISYGTEPMPESTLRQFHQRFPQVALQQSYGLSEVGVLRSKSRASDSLWMKIGGEGYETRIVDGLLEIKADSVMLGYLNAPSPFTEDGWFITGDAVETDGDYLRILGRTSEMINVGGEKVFPAEVESVLLQIPGVKDATVYGEAHPITGAIVAARFNLHEPEPLPSFRRRMREYCRERLAPFKVPAKIELVDAEQFSSRFKKMRRP